MRKPFLQPQTLPTSAKTGPNSTPLDERLILTVSQLNAKAKSVVESELGTVWLEGEISNFIQATSGHWYFTLKDANAQIKCAMFKFKNRLIRLSPDEGDKVIVKGKVSLYEARGDYQMIADYMEPSGLGKLQQELNALIKRLDASNFFAIENKKSLPYLPKAIGVITSPSGAAIHDVIAVLQRRCPMIPVIVYPCVVQGPKAFEGLIAALRTAIKRNECDVILITRGGGSLEDLWCFNNEQLASELYQCDIPIVAAIGHEVDVTITELVADLRAPTPSAAAELVAPDQQSLWQKLDTCNQDLSNSIHATIYQLQTRLNVAKLTLKDPQPLISKGQRQLEKLIFRLQMSYSRNLKSHQMKLSHLSQSLTGLHPKEKLAKYGYRLDKLRDRSRSAIQVGLNSKKNELSKLAGNLQALSPLSTLSRGYSVTKDTQSNKVITKVSQTAKNQKLSILLTDGEINCK